MHWDVRMMSENGFYEPKVRKLLKVRKSKVMCRVKSALIHSVCLSVFYTIQHDTLTSIGIVKMNMK